MACPARKVAGKGDGAALLQDIHLAERILKAACAASHIPVTLKIRKGYYDSDDVVEDFARMAEQCGACAIAVHGRSAQQLYRGSADRNAVARAAAATGLPVIATGDVFTRRDADAYFTDFGASAVMAARGAQGNPWIFAAEREGGPPGTAERESGPPGTAERVAVARRHARALHDIMPKRLASMRKHFGWYFKGSPQAAAVRRSLNECRQLEDYLALLDSLGEQ
jgi:nifR3 family TIM-barrel protein